MRPRDETTVVLLRGVDRILYLKRPDSCHFVRLCPPPLPLDEQELPLVDKIAAPLL